MSFFFFFWSGQFYLYACNAMRMSCRAVPCRVHADACSLFFFSFVRSFVRSSSHMAVPLPSILLITPPISPSVARPPPYLPPPPSSAFVLTFALAFILILALTTSKPAHSPPPPPGRLPSHTPQDLYTPPTTPTPRQEPAPGGPGRNKGPGTCRTAR